MVDIAEALLGDLAAPYALITSAQRYIGTLVMDVTVREVHSDEDTITVHPVETGTPISDHVFANPKVVEIVCAASDSTAGITGYAQTVYEQMLALKAQREPFDIATGKRFYENMLFANITVVTDETSEFALMVTARFQEVIITSTSGAGSSDASYSGQASSQGSSPDTAPTSDAGPQQTSAAPAVQPLPAGAGNDAGAAGASNVG